MDEFNSIIDSEQKTEGRGIRIMSVFFMLPIIALVPLAIQQQSLASLLAAIGFLAVVASLFAMSTYQKKKYNKLGDTPLTLVPAFCKIGSEFSASIEITRENFNKVKRISITSWKYSKVSGDSYRYEKVWQASLTPTIKYNGNKTILAFSFTIPIGQQPSYTRFFSKNKHHWEVSFEFVESMQNIKRSWKLPVKI